MLTFIRANPELSLPRALLAYPATVLVGWAAAGMYGSKP